MTYQGQQHCLSSPPGTHSNHIRFGGNMAFYAMP
jgi:hypothetical protein